nr:hypothetical protein [uncultured Draconibacterium sp.]
MQENIVPFRVGTWLPFDQSILENWIEALISEVESHKKLFHPVLEELKNLLEVMPKYTCPKAAISSKTSFRTLGKTL